MILISLITLLDPINGDEFGLFFDKHFNYVYNKAYRYTHNIHDAEDIVQQTFIKVWRNWNKYANYKNENVIPLLVTYTEHTALDFLKRNKKYNSTISLIIENDDEETEIDLPDDTYAPDKIVIGNEEVERITVLIDSLPEKQREVMMLKYKYNHNDSEISQLLGIDVSAVSSRINRARNTLRKQMEDYNR